MSAPASVVVIGGGIAGVTTARRLRSGGFEGPISIVEREPACYDRPPLSKAAFVGGASLESLAFATPEEFAAERIELLTGVGATGLAPGRVTLDDGRTLEAEAIVLATGAAARPPDFPGADHPAIGVLRTFADTARIRAAARPGATVLVVGAGFIGAELVSGLVALGASAVLVDAEEIPGARALGDTLAAHLHAMHAAHGVDVRRATAVAATPQHVVASGQKRPFDSGVDDRIRPLATDPAGGVVVELNDGSSVTAEAVAVGVGIVIDTSLAEAAGVETDHAILVDEAGRTSVPGIWAVGDATRKRAPDGGLAAPSGHWEAAVLDGTAAADAILGTEPAPRGADWFWSDRYGIHLEVVGRLTGEGTEVVRWAAPDRPAAVFRTDGGLLVGAASIDDANTVRAARRLIDHRTPVDAERLADPAFSLRDLLRAARG